MKSDHRTRGLIGSGGGTVRRLGILRNNRGTGTFGCLFMILLIVAGGYTAYLFAIPYYHYNSFEQAIADMVPYYKGQTADYIQQDVIKIARDGYGLDLKPEQVKVQIPPRENLIVIDITYERKVELPFYTHTLEFKPHLTGAAY